MKTLRIIILKPSKYAVDGYVERFHKGFMPNSTVPHLRSMVPAMVGDIPVELHVIDEYVHTSLGYLELLRSDSSTRTLLCLAGVQSHQFHRALDLAALASSQGCMVAMGGPHVMTCETNDLRGMGVSFAQAEAELIWDEMLADAVNGELKPVYGEDQRWNQELRPPAIIPPSAKDLKRYIVPMLGLYPARGCPFQCNFCSVIKLAGRRVRSQPVETTMKSLRMAKAAGVKTIMFTSDNFNKYPDAPELLEAMIDEKLGLHFFAQCDLQISRSEDLLALMSRAGCTQIFLGAESFDRKTLIAAHKTQNRPEVYEEIVRMCRKHHVMAHFSNILGFPTQTRADIDDHVRMLNELAPAHASFYILTPIPGTEQYGDFMEQDLITEPNMDRYDTTTLVWKHPHLSARELEDALFSSYARFYTMGNSIRKLGFIGPGSRGFKSKVRMLGAVAYNRMWAMRHIHPMSGGVGRVRLDSVSDYIGRRRDTYGFELAPLPGCLKLPEKDERANRLVGGSLIRPSDLLAATCEPVPA